MTFPATAEVEEFDEALAWFTARFPLTAEILEALGSYAGARAWTIAAVVQLDAVLAAHRVLSEAIAAGTELSKVVKSLGAALADFGFSGARLETIALNHMQGAYNAGRFLQLSDPELIAARPYRQFDGIGDFRQTDICRARDGVTLPTESSWWEWNWPPLHHRCRSTVRSLSEREARLVPADKLIAPLALDNPSSGFGATPDATTAWGPTSGRYPPALWDEYQVKREAYLSRELRGITEEEEGWLLEAASAEILRHGELSFLRTGMRPESLEYARQQLEGGDPTLMALRREPIVVDVWPGGDRRLSDGRHRLVAAQEVGADALRVLERERGPRGGFRGERVRVMRIDKTTPVLAPKESES